MNKLCINTVLEHMNTLERMKNKYDGRASDLYKQGNVDRAAKLDYKVELYDREICGIEYTLRKLGLDVWKTKEGEWVIPTDDIIRAT